ncbi:transcriptional regulator family: Fungal Specific TF [Penicillium angulare]|uniref:transcriptional regulator family: Fungal Specific TF n=1 Tax=Penicillium angulare TaxID=116970 RepID=UPI0025402764|nr:transcriptional regulator family: Fungal Specific TF [Penicillium angulare]KAJ5278667.1 transcriptional regulator family: Fungal Specific TF [Penicillium angulare]
MNSPGNTVDVRPGQKRRLGRSAPRSRSGCAICKKRKVRCDEGLPTCANCTRLGAECHYQRVPPRKRLQAERPSSIPASFDNLCNGSHEYSPMPRDAGNVDQSMDIDLDLNSTLDNSTLDPDNNGLFFDFDAFSRNALDLWCSPSTLLPESLLTLDYDTSAVDNSFNDGPDIDASLNRNVARNVGREEGSRVVENPQYGNGASQKVSISPRPENDANLLRDIVPNFNRMATTILAPRANGESGADDSITRRSDALGRYFHESVFVPAVTSIDNASWRTLCGQILVMARRSSIISSSVVALSQLHFNKFGSNAERKESHALRNGQNLTSYLYIFAKETLIEGLEEQRKTNSRSLHRELFIGLFLLTCFEFIDKEDIQRSHQIEWADYLLQNIDQTDTMQQQILKWLVLCDMKLVIFGGNGILTRQRAPISLVPSAPTDSAQAEHTIQQDTINEDPLSPPRGRLKHARLHQGLSASSYSGSPVSLLKESILRDVIHFYHLSQQFLRRIAMLDRHRRPRGSLEDEKEVTASANKIINDLHQLWHTRPAIMSCELKHLQELLQDHHARDIFRLLCVTRASFWSNFCYLYRAAWWNHSIQEDEMLAASDTWVALRQSVEQPVELPTDSVGDVNVNEELPISTVAMWTLFTYATECTDPAKVAWCIAKLRQLDSIERNFGSAGEYASIHAGKAARLLQEVTDRQTTKACRIDSLERRKMQLQNRTFIITGGASGLGLETAKALVGAGAYVGLLDLNKLPANVENMPPHQIKDYQVDISSTKQVSEAICGILEWTNHTNAPIGGVVCCAGILAPGKIMNSRFESLSLQKITQAININLVGTLDIIRQVVPHIARLPEEVDPENESERGVIIMVSSAAAFDGQQGQVAYSATKGAIQALTLPLARDLSPYGIRAVSIAPNMFSTPMTAQGKMPEKARLAIESQYEWPKRAGKPAEFAEFVLEICRNRMLNGCCLRLDGAMRLPAKI